VICKEIFLSDHIISQMFKRNISVEAVKLVLKNGEIITRYTDDKPYPSYLFLGIKDNRPLHLLVDHDEDSEICIMVTIYEPDRRLWSADLKTKIK